MSKVIEKVGIFGATGQTGLCCMEHALKKGIHILINKVIEALCKYCFVCKILSQVSK
jgi:hypothetical protein